MNLFSQIHCKFEEYFKVVANFEYLQESVAVHLQKLKESRRSIKKVKEDYIEKSIRLRKKIIERQNIEKVVKIIKQVRSIKKLPLVLESILSSSLPYEAISLLQDTKSTLDSLNSLTCLVNTASSIRKS